jgi:hypothetical protein
MLNRNLAQKSMFAPMAIFHEGINRILRQMYQTALARMTTSLEHCSLLPTKYGCGILTQLHRKVEALTAGAAARDECTHV